MVTIDFGPNTRVDMRDMASVWEEVFVPSSFADGFDGRYTHFSISPLTHNFFEYQLDTRDGVDGVGPGSGAAVWFFGDDFDYDGNGRPTGGTAEDIHVFSAGDVNRDYETYRVFLHGFEVSLPTAVEIVETQNLDPLLEGESLRILGHRLNDFLVGRELADELYGYGGRDTLRGGLGNDFLDGGAGADQLIGDGGNDRLVWHAPDTKVNGGFGYDTLELRNHLNLTTLSDTRIVNIEKIDMRGGGRGVLTLDESEVLAISSTRDDLKIVGDFGDVVHRGAGWSDGGIVDGFHVYTQGLATLLVDTDITSLV